MESIGLSHEATKLLHEAIGSSVKVRHNNLRVCKEERGLLMKLPKNVEVNRDVENPIFMPQEC